METKFWSNPKKPYAPFPHPNNATLKFDRTLTGFRGIQVQKCEIFALKGK